MWSMQWSKPWWPSHLGEPNSSGSQNNFHYAYFGAARRLAINDNGQIRIYDTGDHWISGVSQQQSTHNHSVKFTSQYGDVNLDALKIVET
jgi:hypothetical protein